MICRKLQMISGFSKEYMLKLFKKQEGIAMTEYILRVKLEAACNMLKFSDRKIRRNFRLSVFWEFELF